MVKICLSIGGLDFDSVVKHLKGAAMAEIRMDLLNFTNEQFISIFAHHRNLIATFRAKTCTPRAVELYKLAIDAGCAYVDIDVGDVAMQQVVDYARSRGCLVVLSYHNFDHTPDVDFLKATITKMEQLDADIVKLACMANSDSDCQRMLSLYGSRTNLVAFCMGAMGGITRLKALQLGAPFTYASIAGRPTAAGQLTVPEIEAFMKESGL